MTIFSHEFAIVDFSTRINLRMSLVTNQMMKQMKFQTISRKRCRWLIARESYHLFEQRGSSPAKVPDSSAVPAGGRQDRISARCHYLWHLIILAPYWMNQVVKTLGSSLSMDDPEEKIPQSQNNKTCEHQENVRNNKNLQHGTAQPIVYNPSDFDVLAQLDQLEKL